jgi:Fungal specific transcription factor domain
MTTQCDPDTSSPSTETHEIEVDYLDPRISNLDRVFPFTPSGIPKKHFRHFLEIMTSYLPGMQRAISLCETFLQSLSWVFPIILRQHIIGHLIPLIYRTELHSLEPPPYGPHDLALLFSTLALGALVDPTLPPYNAEARHYQRVARAALCLQSVFTERSMATIKSLHLMSMYYGMSGTESNTELCYSCLNLASQAALQVRFEIQVSQSSDRPLTIIIRLGSVCYVARQPLIRG